MLLYHHHESQLALLSMKHPLSQCSVCHLSLHKSVCNCAPRTDAETIWLQGEVHLQACPWWPWTEHSPPWVKGLSSLPGPRLSSPRKVGLWFTLAQLLFSDCPHSPVPSFGGCVASSSLPFSWPHWSSGQGFSPLSIRVRMSGLEMA